MDQLVLIAEEAVETVAAKSAAAEVIELTVEQLADVGGGVAYVLI